MTVGPVAYSAAWLIIVTAAVVIAQSLVIALAYYRTLRRLRASDRRRPSGMRAWHICTIAVVFAGYAFMVAVGVLDIIGIGIIPRDARLVAYATLNVLAIASLILISLVIVDRRRTIADIPHKRATDQAPDQPQ